MGDFEEKINKIKEKFKELKENKKFKIIVAIVLIIIAAIFLTIRFTGDNNNQQSVAQTEEGQTKEEAPSKLYVDIDGEVKNPGVYEITPQSRIYDVIKLAGGLTDNADTTTINQAEKVEDGQKITIPSKNTADQNQNQESGTQGSSDQKNGKVNINTADATGLQEIPGIGPTKAEKIITYRNTNGKFKSIEDITNVNGIGTKTFQSIKEYITI